VTLLQPIWLFLLLPVGAALLIWKPPTRLLSVLRITSLALVILALSGLSLKLPSRAGTVIVVADRSQSMPLGSEAAQKEALELLHRAMGADDRLGVVAFGETVAVEQLPQTDKFGGFVNEVGREASTLAEAVDTGLSLIPRDGPGKVLVLSDGRWTGRDPAAVTVRAASRGVAIDYRPLERPAAHDVAIIRLDAPSTVNPGEGFMIAAWAQAPTAQQVTFELRRGDQVLSSGQRQLTSGLNRLTFRDRAGEPGTQAYSLEVRSANDDPVRENNHARVLVGVTGHRPLLYVTNSLATGLPRLLEAGGLKVTVSEPEAQHWTLEELSRYSAAVLENVPAEKIGGAGMETLAAWVRETGAGLMITGGQLSYGPGGYYKSPLDPILPVSMELRNEHRKLAVAIVVALDRSGSMQAPAGGGKRKMDLANLGTAEVLDLLSPMDELGVIAVDTSPHTIVDLAQVTNKDRVRGDILRIDSLGGGIYIEEALKASFKMIAGAKSGTKHVILFADTMDSEEPGDYVRLIEQAKKANITVSVIGMGKDKDKDSDLLRDIAKRGGGRVFFTDKPEELPRLFAQDTFVVARSTFLDEPTHVRATSALTALAGRPFDFTQTIGGYNLCYLRPEATLGAVTTDEYRAPVVAAWQAGIGRVLCYTGEVDGKFTGAIARWNDVGEFYSSLARWTTGPGHTLSENMLVTQELKGGVNVVQLHLDPDRKGEPFAGVPRVTLLRSRGGSTPVVDKTTLRWTGPDTLAAELPLGGDATALATVEVPGQNPVVLPPVCLPYSPEFAPATGDAGLLSLDRMARATGGVERVDLSGIWKDLPKLPRYIPIAPWLLLAAIVVFLLEILERRTGMISRHGVWMQQAAKETAERGRRWTRARPKPVVVDGAAPVVVPTAQASKPPSAPDPATERAGMVDALRQARHRSRGRLEK
jgi:Mg-chelatase subunit ChlD